MEISYWLYICAHHTNGGVVGWIFWIPVKRQFLDPVYKEILDLKINKSFITWCYHTPRQSEFACIIVEVNYFLKWFNKQITEFALKKNDYAPFLLSDGVAVLQIKKKTHFRLQYNYLS